MSVDIYAFLFIASITESARNATMNILMQSTCFFSSISFFIGLIRSMVSVELDSISGQMRETTYKIDQLAEKANKLSAQMDKDSAWVNLMTQNTTKLTQCNELLNDIDSKVFGIDGLYNEISTPDFGVPVTDLSTIKNSN